MKMISLLKSEHKHEHGRAEITFVLVITFVLIFSLVFRQIVHIPKFLIPLFLLIFLFLKISHVIREGGTLIEDYASMGTVTLFLILFLILREEISPALTLTFILILLYSTGLMFWIKKTFTSRKITHFLISYATAAVMTIFLFAGAYHSVADQFFEQGQATQLSFNEALYFSTITFTTVGFGDITPLGINRFFAAFEAFIAVVINVALIGYLLASGRYNNY